MKRPELTDEEKSKLCLECGWCCKNLIIQLAVCNPYVGEIYRAWGVDVVKSEDGKLYAVIPHPCENLNGNECNLYGKKIRPQVCKKFEGWDCDITAKHCLWLKEK